MKKIQIDNKGKLEFQSAGFGFLVVLAAVTTYVCLLMTKNQYMYHNALFHAGMDVLGTYICAVVFYGCMGDKKHGIDESTEFFGWMILQVALAFYLNASTWFLEGKAALVTVNLWINVISAWIDLAIVLCFWRYIYTTFKEGNKTEKYADYAMRAGIIPFVLIVGVNLFTPFGFGIDQNGRYFSTSNNWTSAVYMILVTIAAVTMLLRSKATVREKAAGFSFVSIPVLGFIVANGTPRSATQYGAILTAIVLMYCLIFADKSRMLYATQSELNTAASIQAAVLPNIYPAFPERPEFDLYASMDPAKEVGGDFYDFFLVDDDHLCMLMADVSGKGVPAALFMMASKIMLDSNAQIGRSPAEILKYTNDAICQGNTEEMFVTVWVGILEISTGKLTAANAGHEFPAIKYGDGNYELFRDEHGFVVGGMEGMQYKEYELTLTPGSRLFVYTDGVPEATNADNELFGTDRMIEALNKDKEADPKSILVNVRKSVDNFVAGAEQFDDLTMMCFEYIGPQASEKK